VDAFLDLLKTAGRGRLTFFFFFGRISQPDRLDGLLISWLV